MVYRIALSISLMAIPLGLRAQTADDYFHGGAQSYIQAEKEKAKKEVFTGLQKFPDDPKLNGMAGLLKKQEEEKPKQQQQQQQQQDQQGFLRTETATQERRGEKTARSKASPGAKRSGAKRTAGKGTTTSQTKLRQTRGQVRRKRC